MSVAVESTGAELRKAAPRLPHPQRILLAGMVLAEVVIFSITGKNFATRHNLLEIGRLSVDIGLLALAMTPVIVTGGIDLSVGSLMGLCAVLFGKMWRDGGMSPWTAALATVGIGGIAGLFNAVLITKPRIPPLIVTLGTFSLFRGLAEGITGGVDNFTNFPASFLALGQSSFLGIPTQIPVLVIAAVGFWILLHRSTVGRALCAIGYNEEGARYAGLPVLRWVGLTYVLSGLCAGVASVIYAAHIGQAKADAGLGYELVAITAVVLGGTSIFGGAGSIGGTLLGLFAITILRRGLQLSDYRTELSDVLTGLLLLAAISLDWRALAKLKIAPAAAAVRSGAEEFEMKNSQLAVLCAVILAAALIVAGGNLWMVNTIRQESHGVSGHVVDDNHPATTGQSGAPMTLAMMPKSKGNAYFIACQKGANEAAKEFGVNLLWDGPTDPDPQRQNDIVDAWVERGVDAIAVAVENRDAISTALRRAKSKGIKVLTWDSDAAPDSRDFFVNQATPEGIGYTLVDNAAKVLGGKGDFAVITASLTAANMNEWRKKIDERLKTYPNIHLVVTEPCDDKQQIAFDKAGAILNAHPEVKLIMAICSPAVPGAAEAVKQSGRQDVKVLGLGLPNDNKRYVHEGVTDDIVLWNTMDLGYLTVVAAKELKDGKLKPGDTTIDAGRLGKLEVKGDNILLGKPFTFTKSNIDKFDF
jgi:rhamnose transport system permease protein